jgi:hypothetical protein
MGPDRLFPQVYTVNDTTLKIKDIIIDPAGTTRNNQGIVSIFGNTFFDQFNPFLSAQKRVSLNRETFFFRNFAQRFHIKGIPDAASCANIYTILFIHG